MHRFESDRRLLDKKKICVVTGSRAEYGLLEPLLLLLAKTPEFHLDIVATGSHLSDRHGNTYQQIEADGFRLAAKIDIDLADDSPMGIARSMGLGLIGFGEVLERIRPDIMVVLGDRYEILAAVEAAVIAKIPVAHIAGGDSTEGAFDEAIRHSITKMSQLHFVTNEISAQRVRQLGEDPNTVFNVGSPGIDQFLAMKLLSRSEIEKELGVEFRHRNFLITYHPETLSVESSFEIVLEALEEFADAGTAMFFTHPNADTAGRMILDRIQAFVAAHPNAHDFASLGSRKYLSLMAQVDVVIGNSSSGLYEAPSLKRPAVNIGDRQKGRLAATSVVSCPAEKSAIVDAVNAALKLDCSNTVNPYGNGGTSEQIVKHLKAALSSGISVKKHFFDLGGARQ